MCHEKPDYSHNTPYIVEIMKNHKRIDILKVEIKFIMVEIENIKDENIAKEVLLRAKDELEEYVNIRVTEIKGKYKLVEHFKDVVTALKILLI